MSKKNSFKVGGAALAALSMAMLTSCSRATPPPAEFTSVGRGAPVSPAIPWQQWRKVEDIEAIPPREIKGYPEQNWLVGPLDGPATGNRLEGFLGAARNGAVPEGIEALKVDIFTSTDFYADRALWTDKRYFRCNSPVIRSRTAVAGRDDRRQAAGVGGVGVLRSRLSTRGDGQPV